MLAVSLVKYLDRHSNLAPLDLTFEAFNAIVHGPSKLSTDWPWWQSLPSSNKYGDRLVDMAIFALGCQALGRHDQNKSLIFTSFATYHTILQLLQLRLGNAAEAITFGAELNTIQLACSGIEVLEDTSNSNTGSLIYYRSCLATSIRAGPEANKSSYGISVLRVMKSKILFIDMTNRKKSFLDCEEWRSIPY